MPDMTECLTCAELETQICDLVADLGALTGCAGVKISEGGVTFDYSGQVSAKQTVLRTLRELYAIKCSGSGELYEFIHVPCVKPATCVGTGCTTSTNIRQNRRRYRR